MLQFHLGAALVMTGFVFAAPLPSYADDAAAVAATVQKLGFRARAVSSEIGPGVFWGVFREATNLLSNEIGPPTNQETLYLFADWTYLFAESGDIQPRTIFEKGAWSWNGGLLALTSDSSVPVNRRQRATRNLLPLILLSGERRRVILVDRNEGVRCLTAPSLDDTARTREIAGYMCMHYRAAKLSRSRSGKLKAKLIRDSWNPKWYGAKAPR